MIDKARQKIINVTSPAKVNLHLQVLGIRSDGFHELAMVMQSISLADNLSFKVNTNGQIKLSTDDPNLSNEDDNLIIKSAKLLKKYSAIDDFGADIYLNKQIPIGAGLAGGSSNAAATLVALNHLWNLSYSTKELEQISSEIGSDIPFCVSGGTQLCFGRGEVLEPITSSISNLSILLLKDPLTSVSTPWAYKEHKAKYSQEYLSTDLEYQIERNRLRNSPWLNPISYKNPPPLQNDLERTVSPLVPSVNNALKILRSISGTLSVSMSGSGPSCFAIFPDLESAELGLNNHKEEIKKAGFDAWCCSFIGTGPKISK